MPPHLQKQRRLHEEGDVEKPGKAASLRVGTDPLVTTCLATNRVIPLHLSAFLRVGKLAQGAAGTASSQHSEQPVSTVSSWLAERAGCEVAAWASSSLSRAPGMHRASAGQLHQLIPVACLTFLHPAPARALLCEPAGPQRRLRLVFRPFDERLPEGAGEVRGWLGSSSGESGCSGAGGGAAGTPSLGPAGRESTVPA